MRHVATKLVLLLLLGAIVNVAVAWSVTLLQASTRQVQAAERGATAHTGRKLTPSEMSWYANNQRMFEQFRIHELGVGLKQQEPTAAELDGGFGLHHIALIENWKRPYAEKTEYMMSKGYRASEGIILGSRMVVASRVQAGWPVPALAVSFWHPPVVIKMDGTIETSKPDSGLQVPKCSWLFPPTDRYVVPVEPLLTGFAINTIFYAAILWLLLAFPFLLRHRWRIKRGLCPACAYPVGPSAVCPECGRPNVRTDLPG